MWLCLELELGLSKRILERYLLAEAARTWAAVTAVLMAVMLSTRFARFLGEAAKGSIPPELLWKVVLLSSLQYLTILIPISLLLGAMLSLGACTATVRSPPCMPAAWAWDACTVRFCISD